MCLDALHDRGLTQINTVIAPFAFTAHGVSFRWGAVLLSLKFKNQPRFLKQKKKQKNT